KTLFERVVGNSLGMELFVQKLRQPHDADAIDIALTRSERDTVQQVHDRAFADVAAARQLSRTRVQSARRSERGEKHETDLRQFGWAGRRAESCAPTRFFSPPPLDPAAVSHVARPTCFVAVTAATACTSSTAPSLPTGSQTLHATVTDAVGDAVVDARVPVS